MNIDAFLYNLPVIGIAIKRLYGYFRNHIAITDAIHVALGFGIGILFAQREMNALVIAALSLGVLGHVYALIKGK